MGHVKTAIKKVLKAARLHRPLVEIRNRVIRPEWWQRDRRAQQFFRRLVRPGSLVFDIGAHHGALTDRFVRLGARVVAVEPQPACCGKLRARFGDADRLTSNNPVVLVPKAVGASEGTARMAIAEGSQVSSCNPDWPSRFPEQKWHEPIDVPVTTLDALIEQYGQPAFCKIDVEGFEPQVLQGLHTPIQSLSLEFALDTIEQTVECLRRLDELGYRAVNYCHHLSYRFALPAPVSPNRAIPLTRSADRGGDLYAFFA